MSDILIVIDFQNDFIDGSLGTPEAQAMVPNVVRKIAEYEAAGKPIIATLDTHREQPHARIRSRASARRFAVKVCGFH